MPFQSHSTDGPADVATQEPTPARRLRRLARFLGIPAAVYFVGFSVLTFPAILSFGSRFFCDDSDGLQNVWNIWWVRKAIVDLHQSPWWTGWLHYPTGTTLLGHTLNPFNGLLAIPLSAALSPVQVHNALVLLAFVGGGWTAFLLAYDATRAYWPSLLSGFAFTFSGYHFAHAEGHLQLVSLEWVPLFVLCWIRLLRAPTVARGIAAAGALGLVILCDYYYFAYCVVIGVMVAGWRTSEYRDALLLFRQPYRRPLAAFCFASLASSGWLAIALLLRSAADPFSGSHPPEWFSADLLAPFIPGAHSAYQALTERYWSALRGNVHESSVYVGITVLGLAVWGFARRRAVEFKDAWMWLAIALVFYGLSLGPELTCAGTSLTKSVMPYAWLEQLLPPLRLSGCPARMMVVVSLALSVLAGGGLMAVLRPPTAKRVGLAALLSLAVAADLWPRSLTTVRPDVPPCVLTLRDLPGTSALLDLSGIDPPLALYHQTIHEKPMAFGYVSRLPRSVVEADERLVAQIERKDLQGLRDQYGFRYLATSGAEPRAMGILCEAPGFRLYDLTKALP